MAKESVSFGFKQKKDETKNYLLEKTKCNEKCKKVCRALRYLEHFLEDLELLSVDVSISAFASLVGVPVGIVSSA